MREKAKTKNIAYLTSSSYNYGGGWIRDALLVKNIRASGEKIYFYSTFFKPFTGEKVNIDSLFFKIGDVLLAHNIPNYSELPVLPKIEYPNIKYNLNRIPFLKDISLKNDFITINLENITAKFIKNIENKIISNISAEIKEKKEQEILDSILLGSGGKLKREVKKMENKFKKNRIELVNTCSVLWSGIISDMNMDLTHIATLQGYDMIIGAYPQDYRENVIDKLKENAKQTDSFIAISKYYAKKAGRELNIPLNKIDVVYNGVDTTLYKPKNVKKKSDVFSITYLGRITPVKGALNLVFAAKHLKEENYKKFQIIISGNIDRNDIDYLNVLKKYIALFGMEKIIEFKFNISQREKIALLNRTDVVVYPTIYPEPFGLVPIESMACGTPVILPDHGAFTEIIEETKGGLLCKPNDSVDLSEKIISLIEDKDLLKRLSETGLKNIKEKFNASVFAKNILEVYKKMS
ncbi:MAG: hypothetical protein DRN66_03980 [Candidatus Nanohalarchaeota archaeon]|nr:MAG: hypothetical protein DRN66_03980 [Candidatus Nanohaloarchaeota archaeon]